MDKIIQELKKTDMPLEQVAYLAGTNLSTLYKFMKGQNIGYKLYLKLAEVLKVKMLYECTKL